MVKIAGKYQLVKNENFVECLNGLGIPEEDAIRSDSLKPILEVVVYGKEISVSTNIAEDNHSPTFILDQEVDEETPLGALKSTAKMNSDTLTVISKTVDGGSVKRIFSFTDTGFVLTLSSGDEKVPSAKSYYKKL